MWSRVVMYQVKHNSYFIVGMVIGVWVSLAVIPLEEESVVCAGLGAAAPAPDDEFTVHREPRPLGAAGPAAGRTLQRPRYYTTELGIRGGILVGVLTSEERLSTQAAAINRTAGHLQPALKFFITASAVSAAPPLPNVVAFTDTREMLKPFHALKYLADNYLEEYDFFFLVTDAGYVNARRLSELIAAISVSRDVYMGEPDPDSQYCSLDAGILLSNSVLRAVHGELDWCVRNSYSPRHHENVGRCVLHAAHAPCARAAQGVEYSAAEPALRPLLADAVTAAPAPAPLLLRLHAHACRERLRRARRVARRLRAALRRAAAAHPPGARHTSWPAGLRRDPGLAPPAPDSRFDHLRWTPVNASHALMPDEHRAVAPLDASSRRALAAVWREAAAWAQREWGLAAPPELVEGARLWEPAAALRYRLVVRAGGRLRLVEAARALGAARLAPVPYVTESARVALVVGAAASDAALARGFLRRLGALCAPPAPDCNVAVWAVAFRAGNASAAEELRAAGRGLPLAVLEAGEAGEGAPWARLGRAALERALPSLPRDRPALLVVPHLEFDRDFLNRVRMNTIRGEQWFLPVSYSRFAAGAALRGGGGAHSGRFEAEAAHVLSFYPEDYEAAARGAGAHESVGALLARAGLRCVRAPEPGAALGAAGGAAARCAERCAAERCAALCGGALAREQFAGAALGSRTALARLVLEATDL